MERQGLAVRLPDHPLMGTAARSRLTDGGISPVAAGWSDGQERDCRFDLRSGRKNCPGAASAPGKKPPYGRLGVVSWHAFAQSRLNCSTREGPYDRRDLERVQLCRSRHRDNSTPDGTTCPGRTLWLLER